MTIQQLKQIIQQQIYKQILLKQITQTGAGEAYQTPNAFGSKASADILNRWG